MRQLIFLVLIVSVYTSFSQTTIEVTVINSKKETLPFANVLVFDKENTESLITFGYTDGNGQVSFNIDDFEALLIECKTLGYKNTKKDVTVEGLNTVELTFKMVESTTELNEVIVYENIPLKVKKDTIVYDASFYSYGTEQVVEDLLKNLPGVSVDSKGTIKVNNIPIEKIMVDGDDLFEKGYSTLSKNMPISPVDKIEVYKKYSNNKLLKDIEDSEKIALNLVLKEDSKRIWFGNFDLNGSLFNFDRYSLKNNLMNFGKKNKVYVLSNFNTIGYDAIKDVQTLINSIALEGNSTLGKKGVLQNRVSTSNTYTGFDDEKTNFNHLKFISVNGITRPNEQIKLKSNVVYAKDLSEFIYNYDERIFSEASIIENFSQERQNKSKDLTFIRFDYDQSISDNSSLLISSKYQNFNSLNNNRFIFNQQSSTEDKSSTKKSFDTYLSYSNKISSHKVLLINSRLVKDNIPEELSVDNFNYSGLFNISNIDNLNQTFKSKFDFSGIEGQLISNKNQNVSEFIIGNENKSDEFKSDLSSNSTNEAIANNQYTIDQNEFYVKYYYSLKSKNIIARPYSELNYLNYSITNSTYDYNTFYFNYGGSVEFIFNNNSSVSINYNKNEHPTSTQLIFGDYILANRNLLTKGVEENKQLIDQSISVNYHLSNYEGSSFLNFYYIANNYENYYSSNQMINQYYTLSQSVLLNDKKSLLSGFHLEQFLNFISSNLKLDFRYNSIQYEASINDIRRNFELKNLNSIIELKSGFKGIFNYQIGIEWSSQSLNSNNLNNSINYIDLLYNLKSIQGKLTIENFQFDNLIKTNSYNFVNFDLRKSFKNNSDVSIEGVNLTNTSKFTNTQISDVKTISSSFTFMPRYILVGYKIRF